MDSSRRRFISAGATTGVAALAGCAGVCVERLPLVGSGMPNDGEVAAEPTESVADGSTTVQFSDLPAPEQSLLRTAIEDGVVRACTTDDGPRVDALRSFANRMSTESNYLVYENQSYALWVRVTDLIYAHTAEPPEGDGNLCC